MSSRLDFRRIARPEILKKIEANRLRRFLNRVGGDYVGSVVDLQGDPLPYDHLSELLGSPRDGYPDGLVDALYYATDFGKVRGAYDALVDAAAQAGFPTIRDEAGERMTAEDLVVGLWVDPRGETLVRLVHAQYCSANPRSFDSFYPKDDAPDVAPDLGPEAVSAMVRDLDAFFDERRGARGVRIIQVSKGAAQWLIVRQPAPWERRVYVTDNGGDEMKQGHPEDYDVLIYHPERRELSVHASSKTEIAKYREVVGRHVFDDPDRFSEAGRVSLEPLRTLGRDSLIVEHLDGLHEITLVEMGFEWRNHVHDRMTRRSDDLFVTFSKFPMPRAHIRYAVFDVVYRKGQPGSAVRVYAGARTSYGRESGHECIKDWLVDRGFLRLRGQVPPSALGNLWRAVAHESESVMTRAEWDTLLGDGAGPAAGLLALAGGPSPTRPCGLGDGQGCRMTLASRTDDGDAVYRCGDEPARCAGVVLTKGKAAGYRINVDGVALTLANAVLGAEGEPVRQDEPGLRAWRLGVRRIGSTEVSFWFAPVTDELGVAAVVNAVRARAESRISCILVASSSQLPARAIDAARRDRIAILPLDQVGSVDGSAMAVDLWPLLDQHRDLLRDADPSTFAGDRFDLILDAEGDRYWCFGRAVTFGPREQAARHLLRMLAAKPGAGVSFDEMQRAHPDVVAATSRESWPQYRQKLMKAIVAKRRKDDVPVPEGLIEAVAGGAYALRLAPARVEWWTRPRSADSAG